MDGFIWGPNGEFVWAMEKMRHARPGWNAQSR